MADARAGLDVRHVILPWARRELRPDDSRARENVARDAHALRIDDDKLSIRHQAIVGDPIDRGRRSRRRFLVPALRAVGLPYEPHPSVPREDRRPLQQASLISAAVALDLLATQTRKLEGERTVLSDLAVVLLHVGSLGGIDELAVERLLTHAQSVTGRNRALLSHQLAARMQEAAAPGPAGAERETTVVGTARPTSPRSVADALRRIDTAADRAIAEARLRLEAQEPIEYKQA
jgi:hypothetical protein